MFDVHIQNPIFKLVMELLRNLRKEINRIYSKIIFKIMVFVSCRNLVEFKGKSLMPILWNLGNLPCLPNLFHLDLFSPSVICSSVFSLPFISSHYWKICIKIDTKLNVSPDVTLHQTNFRFFKSYWHRSFNAKSTFSTFFKTKNPLQDTSEKPKYIVLIHAWIRFCHFSP